MHLIIDEAPLLGTGQDVNKVPLHNRTACFFVKRPSHIIFLREPDWYWIFVTNEIYFTCQSGKDPIKDLKLKFKRGGLTNKKLGNDFAVSKHSKYDPIRFLYCQCNQLGAHQCLIYLFPKPVENWEEPLVQFFTPFFDEEISSSDKAAAIAVFRSSSLARLRNSVLIPVLKFWRKIMNVNVYIAVFLTWNCCGP